MMQIPPNNAFRVVLEVCELRNQYFQNCTNNGFNCELVGTCNAKSSNRRVRWYKSSCDLRTCACRQFAPTHKNSCQWAWKCKYLSSGRHACESAQGPSTYAYKSAGGNCQASRLVRSASVSGAIAWRNVSQRFETSAT